MKNVEKLINEFWYFNLRFDKTFWLKRKEKNYAKDKKDGDCIGFDDDDELREEREATSRHDITQPAHDFSQSIYRFTLLLYSLTQNYITETRK